MDSNTLRGHLDLLLLATLEHVSLYGVQLFEHVHAVTDSHFQFKEGTFSPALQPCIA